MPHYNFYDYIKHGILFLVTFVSVAFAWGLWWSSKIGLNNVWDYFIEGVTFSFCLMFFLLLHEFGHFFAARYHKIYTSLPYFIPMPLIPLGTLGAMIRIREKVSTSSKLFDIAIAGPLAGFIASLIILLWGFFTLPEPTYVLQLQGHEMLKMYIHEYGTFPPTPFEANTTYLGYTILFELLSSFFNAVPPLWELYHYPVLTAGWFGLFFTALNLLPVGQLDGGHIIFAMIGKKYYNIFVRGFISLFTTIVAVTMIDSIRAYIIGYNINGYFAWIIWALMAWVIFKRVYRKSNAITATITLLSLALTYVFVMLSINIFEVSASIWFFWLIILLFFIKIEHPPVLIADKLDKYRLKLGIIAFIILILCISLNPIYIK